MICPSCNKETQGIKVNGKLFCPQCGELLNPPTMAVPVVEPVVAASTNVETAEQNPNPFEIPKPKVITEEGAEITDELKKLEAEEEVLEVLEKAATKQKTPKPTLKIKNQEIKKHNRKRVHHQKEKEFVVAKAIQNENPNVTPESEPEKAVPEVKIEESIFPLLRKEEKVELEQKKAVKQKAFVSFLKSGIQNPRTAKKPKKSKKGLYITLGIFGVIVSLGALVVLINVIYFNPQKNLRKAESKVTFKYQKPAYLPPGYDISPNTTGTSNSIKYVYFYLPNKSKELSISISKTELTNENIFETVIKPKGLGYIETENEGQKYWFVGENSLYFLKENKLYEISSSDTIALEELTKIAKGL